MFEIYDLFESVGIIVDAKLKELSLDRTILATIIDNSESSKGIYKVSYESAVFSANSADPSLEIDDLVYVGVPQGEYSNAYIISKKVISASEQQVLLPFQNFIKELELQTAQDEYTISSSSSQTLLWSNGLSYCPFINLNKSKRLGISAKIQANIKDQLEGKQDYGIRLYIKSKEVVENQTFFYLNTIDFNIYKMLVPHAYITEGQKIVEELFDISDINNIVEIRAELYGNDNLSESNAIKITDFKIYLGNLLEEYHQEGLTLYTATEPYYSDTVLFEGKIYARLVYKENNEIKVITSYMDKANIPNNITIEWFKNDNIPVTADEDNNWRITVDSSKLNLFKENEEYKAQVKYNSIEADVLKEYEAKLVLSNTTSNRKIFRPATNEFNLTAPITSFKDIYNPDGSIVSNSLIKSNDYMLKFPSSPYAKAGTENKKIKIKVEIIIPSSKTNLYIEPSEQGNYKKGEDIINGIIYSQDFFVDLVTGAFPQLTLLPFSIGEFYSPGANNNTIQCKLSAVAEDGDIIESEIYSVNIEFGRSGICKSDYVLYPTITDEAGNRCHSIKIAQGSQINIKANLYNSAGEELEITHPIKWSWYERKTPEENNKILINPIGNSDCVLISELHEYDKNHDYNYVLRGDYEVYKEGTIFTSVFCLIPIGINASKLLTEKGELAGYRVAYLQGPTLITYNSAGGEPSFYQSPYELYSGDNYLYSFVKWETFASKEEEEENMAPSLYQNDLGKYYVHAPTTFTKGAQTSVYKAIMTDNKDSVLWIQPITSYQTKSFSSIVNDWDGRSIKIQDKNNTKNYIMTPMLGAGKKDENGFSGVLLGDVGNEDGSTPVTGIYGYGQGEQSFAFKEDGTAFIGKKSNGGSIEFDGNRGLIKSQYFDGDVEDLSNNIGTTGSCWDLKNGIFIANNGYFRGYIEADQGGKLGPWQLTSDGLFGTHLIFQKSKYSSRASEVRESTNFYNFVTQKYQAMPMLAIAPYFARKINDKIQDYIPLPSTRDTERWLELPIYKTDLVDGNRVAYDGIYIYYCNTSLFDDEHIDYAFKIGDTGYLGSSEIQVYLEGQFGSDNECQEIPYQVNHKQGLTILKNTEQIPYAIIWNEELMNGTPNDFLGQIIYRYLNRGIAQDSDNNDYYYLSNLEFFGISKGRSEELTYGDMEDNINNGLGLDSRSIHLWLSYTRCEYANNILTNSNNAKGGFALLGDGTTYIGGKIFVENHEGLTGYIQINNNLFLVYKHGILIQVATAISQIANEFNKLN